MNELEKAILAEMQKTDYADDIISRSVKKDKPKKRGKTRYFLALGLAVSIGYCTYYVCKEIWETEHKPLAIPAAIWGTCATSYVMRKINGKR